jgi:phosphatidylinositol alpha-mannosyltransferase
MMSIGPVFGGAEGYSVKLAKLLTGRYHVRVIVADGEIFRRLQVLNIEAVQLPREAVSSVFGRYYYAAREIYRQLRIFRPDGIHLNGQTESYLSAIPWLFRVPIVITRHVPFTERIPAFKRLLEVANMILAAKVICVSTLIRRQLSAAVPAKKLVVLYNWLDYIPPARAYARDRTESTFRLLFVGRLLAGKGLFDVIEAMRHVENASLDVVGSGCDMEAARAAATGFPVVFHGYQEDCGPFYRAADLLIFPSHPVEGQGQVPFEAMAHGLPCLISDIEVAMETADGGSCAEVFPCGNSVELARKIAALQADPARLRELRQKGIERFRSTYTVESIRDPYFQLFDSVLSRGRR